MTTRSSWGASASAPSFCKPRRPFAKGKIERLIRFVKDNFLAGRDFTDITALNKDAALWCADQAGRWRRAVAYVPAEEREAACRALARKPEVTEEVALWLCPRRRITFDEFVGYESRRFGMPYRCDRRKYCAAARGACSACTATTSPARLSPTPSRGAAETAGATASGPTSIRRGSPVSP